MGGTGARRRRAGRAGAVLVTVVLVVLLASAAPALAGKAKVVSGATTLSVPSAGVTALTGSDVALIDIAPVAFSFQWDGALSWQYRAPLAAGGSFDFGARRGMLVHKGGLRFVNVATGASLPLTGLRVYVNGPSSVVLQAAVGGPPLTRADVLVSSTSPEFTRRGKLIAISGVQFRMTPQLAIALQTALVGTFDTTTVFAAADLSFKLK
jgi:hypothetical protein